MRRYIWLLLPALLFILNSCKESSSGEHDYSTWNTYAGSKEGNRYSSNNQVTTQNVSQLQVAWTYSTKDKDPENRSQLQCNPIIIDGILYATSPQSKLFALNAATGQQKWSFNPYEQANQVKDKLADFNVNRGVTYWQNEAGTEKRILYSVGHRLYAIDAQNGTPIPTFGQHGFIDLRQHLDQDNTENAYVAGTTPGVIYKDLLIWGMRLSEGPDALAGHIRAFDVRTGERRWIFHTIPHPGETGYDTWENPDSWKRIGGANNWAGMALDEKRGIVYVPTGSATPDFYGGVRKGQNLFANSVIALDAATGKYIWHYQVVHHDLWDRDLPANPNLVTVNQNGKKIDAIAQITKHGYVFLLDRTNGKPLFPIKEVPVPASDLPGEEAWPTQPIPTLPEPFARQKFGPEDVTDLTPETHREMMEKYKQVKHQVMFAPPGKEGSWIFPGFDGGGEWGGAAVDPESNILYVNSSEMPWALTMIDVPKKNAEDYTLTGVGTTAYNKYCIACHGTDLKGSGSAYPSLVNIGNKYTKAQVSKIIENGWNMMPSFKQIPASEKEALLAFLLNTTEQEPKLASNKPGGSEASNAKEPVTSGNTPETRDLQDEVPYTMTGYNRFLDKDGYPGIKPPWGTLNAVDLNSGKLLWKVPLGEYEALTKRGIPPTGTENYGGPLVTKGGLVFIAATQDAKIRAFDKKTGKVLWQADLPVPGYATPAAYAVAGRQYIVIACGGGKLGSKSGDTYIAFALPVTAAENQ